ncbi:hypothetical protein ABPG75_002499 [Micractinium tetrahymenae]
MAATVLASQAALAEGVLEAGRLEQLATAAGLRVRRVGSTQADLLVSKAGTSLPFLLWRGASGSSAAKSAGGASPPAVAAAAAAARKLASSFRQAYVLLPHELLGDAAVLDAVASLGCEAEGLCFVWMPMGASFTERALALALALLPAEAEAAAWRAQQAQAVASAEAVNQVLLGLPLPAGSDVVHHANMLRLLGGINEISQRRADEIAAHTDLDGHAAAAIMAFFGKGGRPAEPPAGLGGLPLQLHNL